MSRIEYRQRQTDSVNNGNQTLAPKNRRFFVAWLTKKLNWNARPTPLSPPLGEFFQIFSNSPMKTALKLITLEVKFDVNSMYSSMLLFLFNEWAGCCECVMATITWIVQSITCQVLAITCDTSRGFSQAPYTSRASVYCVVWLSVLLDWLLCRVVMATITCYKCNVMFWRKDHSFDWNL